LKSRTKVIIPYHVVKFLLVQKELGEKKAHWMTSLKEYDIEIKPAQIVRGHGIFKLVANLVNPPNDGFILLNESMPRENKKNYAQTMLNSWYSDIKFYLTHGTTPKHLDPKKRRELRLQFS
jgi:hypothetical protein